MATRSEWMRQTTADKEEQAAERYHWSEARQRWVHEDGSYIPGDVLPGSEHPRHYSPEELSEMTVKE